MALLDRADHGSARGLVDAVGLREAFYGIRRFDAFQESLGIARNTLTDRLRRLVEEELLKKRPYQTEPVRYDYVLTEKGRASTAYCW